jgi:hypothetical protein
MWREHCHRGWRLASVVAVGRNRPRRQAPRVRVFDCFTFFNELDLLEIRLQLLDDVVDYFVLVEAGRTFSNQPKPLFFAENRARFARWEDKIVYVAVEHDGTGLDFSRPAFWDPARGPWSLERRQRDGFAIITPMLEDADVILVGDVDEIPAPSAIRRAGRFLQEGRKSVPGYVFRQVMHHYYLNMQSTGLDRLHLGTCAVRASYFRDTPPNRIRSARWQFPRIGQGGWHFSFLGDPAEIARKIRSYSHQEFNRPQVTDDKRIARVVRTGSGVTDSFGHYYERRALEDYPSELSAILSHYPQLVCDTPTPVSAFDVPRRALRIVSNSDQLMEVVVRGRRRVGFTERRIRDGLRAVRDRYRRTRGPR